ncbi:hypothetical protein DXB00_00135 [Butyricicoccus sp. OF10-2]|nr:hypothetical protein DXB00_00135 [Butyricicoccus sp. OF10-2]
MKRQYRIIQQERFTSKFCVLIRRGFLQYFVYCKKSRQRGWNSRKESRPISGYKISVKCRS